MTEEFKTIIYKGTEITVSNMGTVFWNGEKRKPYLNHDGYLVCSIKTQDGWRSIGVHRLVAHAFVPNPNNYPEVNHLDYDRTNPKANNLEWTTHENNVRYSNCNRPDYNGVNNPNYKNKTLYIKYKNNPELAKLKQSRPGSSNGRSKSITLFYDNEPVKMFDFIGDCIQYLIDKGVSNGTEKAIRASLMRAHKNNKPYKEHYTYIVNE